MPCVNWKNDLTENLIWNHGLSQSIRLQNWGNLFFPRPLQERQVVRVGTTTPVPVNVRIIAATNRTLTDEVAAGRFRDGLFFRIAVALIKLPPLRIRKGDFTLLVDHLLERINTESAADPAWEERSLSPSARNQLQRHVWPGNIRELTNTLTRAAVWSAGSTITG